ncbi:ATP-binding cassette domain-containing protein [Galbitalea soli]|uniref:ABC transporter ATP-binding protein n=1 Tax=Galbitalea soli TaxID=1268042 RepID=A0A7C9TQU2_9MICO|nr:ABC transporter ATP-binding protein [Galbitalea soli]NEM90864.1 ABC transporter ATP-binding protein [Galbitalea soli]NYJ31584.1 ABC-type multidrug transport system ATPase subunit [Galbitalea soli]
MLQIRDLHVRLGAFELGPVDVDVEHGAVLSLIGTNGSGKSTLIRSVLGLLPRSGGTATWHGHSVPERRPEVLSTIGYMTDSNKDLLAEFTAREFWNYCRLASERARGDRLPDALTHAERYASLIGLPIYDDRPLSALSLGNSRKAQLIGALIGDPDLLFLDESFIGLDFIAARAVEELLVTLRAEGRTIIASSHDLDLAGRVADQVLVLHDGRVALNSSVSDLGGSGKLEGAVRRSLDQARALR